jgi:hypothetical protein
MVDAGHLLTGAELFDQRTGIAVIPLPRQAAALPVGRQPIRLIASDNQEAKNVNTDSTDLLPNTARKVIRVRVVRGPTITWIAPEANACVSGSAQLSVVANSTAAVSSVGFYAGSRQVGRVRRAAGGIYTLAWNASGRGKRTLTAVVSDSSGREARTKRTVRICG